MIKIDIDMPKTCDDCPCCHEHYDYHIIDYYYCDIAPQYDDEVDRWRMEKRADWCPLIEVVEDER